MTLFRTLAVAGLLAAATTGAHAAASTAGETLGQRLADGSMSEQQFEELIQFSGATPEQAKAMTLDQVVAKRWQQS